MLIHLSAQRNRPLCAHITFDCIKDIVKAIGVVLAIIFWMETKRMNSSCTSCFVARRTE